MVSSVTLTQSIIYDIILVILSYLEALEMLRILLALSLLALGACSQGPDDINKEVTLIDTEEGSVCIDNGDGLCDEFTKQLLQKEFDVDPVAFAGVRIASCAGIKHAMSLGQIVPADLVLACVFPRSEVTRTTSGVIVIGGEIGSF